MINLKGCSNITDAAVVALAEHCSGIQLGFLSSCVSVPEPLRNALGRPDIARLRSRVGDAAGNPLHSPPDAAKGTAVIVVIRLAAIISHHYREHRHGICLTELRG
jgi:hypothetical protein